MRHKAINEHLRRILEQDEPDDFKQRRFSVVALSLRVEKAEHRLFRDITRQGMPETLLQVFHHTASALVFTFGSIGATTHDPVYELEKEGTFGNWLVPEVNQLGDQVLVAVRRYLTSL